MLQNQIKYLLVILITFISTKGLFAQFSKAAIEINGLTCSACSYATEKSIRELIFVDSVSMDLTKNIAFVYFNKKEKVNIDALSKKVYSAGFSVGSIEAWYSFNNQLVSKDFCFEYLDDTYIFFNVSENTMLNGETKLKFVAKKYMTKSEYRAWKPKIDAIRLCKESNRNYFVTL